MNLGWLKNNGNLLNTWRSQVRMALLNASMTVCYIDADADNSPSAVDSTPTNMASALTGKGHMVVCVVMSAMSSHISTCVHAESVYCHVSQHLAVQVVDALEYAGKDENVCGFVTCIGEGGSRYGLAQTQELRDAILEFR